MIKPLTCNERAKVSRAVSLHKRAQRGTHSLSVLAREEDRNGAADALTVEKDLRLLQLGVREDVVERRLRVELDALLRRTAAHLGQFRRASTTGSEHDARAFAVAVSMGTSLVNGRCAKTGASKAQERTRGTKGRQRCTASFPRTPLRSVVGVPARRACADTAGGGQTRTDGDGRQVLDGRGVHSMATLGVRTVTLVKKEGTGKDENGQLLCGADSRREGSPAAPFWLLAPRRNVQPAPGAQRPVRKARSSRQLAR